MILWISSKSLRFEIKKWGVVVKTTEQLAKPNQYSSYIVIAEINCNRAIKWKHECSEHIKEFIYYYAKNSNPIYNIKDLKSFVFTSKAPEKEDNIDYWIDKSNNLLKKNETY